MRRTLSIVVLVAVIAVAAYFAIGCGISEQKSNETTNPKVKVELLFENDGCKIYRFFDFMEPVYYVDCRGAKQTSANWQHMEGKVTRSFQSTTVDE